MSQNEQHIWKPVTRPGPHFGFPRSASMDRPPAVPAKPGGKMIVYVYESPKTLHASGSKITYPCSDECVRYKKPRWKKKTINVLPTRPSASSVGGKLFHKQRQRMKEYVVKPPASYEYQHHRYTQPPVNSNAGRERSRSLERVVNMTTSIGTKNMPALINNTFKTKQKNVFTRPVWRPLQSPPPEWRAKVESNYRLLDGYIDNQPIRWSRNVHEAGYESAPAGKVDDDEESDLDDTDLYPNFINNGRRISGGHLQQSQFYHGVDIRKSIRPATNQNSVLYSLEFPSYENDFNARAVGWSQAYIDSY